MKKTMTIYELLGKVKDNKDNDIYVKYMNRMTETEDTMWACVENIIYKLDNKVIYLNDEVEIKDEEEFEEIEKLENPTLAEYLHTTGEDLYYQDMKIYNKINELIKNQKRIIERINNENNK